MKAYKTFMSNCVLISRIIPETVKHVKMAQIVIIQSRRQKMCTLEIKGRNLLSEL